MTGASEGTRTHDLTITNRLLYQLSYAGSGPLIIAKYQKKATLFPRVQPGGDQDYRQPLRG